MSGAQRKLQLIAMTTLRLIGAAVACFAAAVCVAWLVGRIASDRWTWSQWLLWIPTPAALFAMLLGLAASMRPVAKREFARTVRRRRAALWIGATLAVAAYFLVIEHRFARWSGNQQSAPLSIVCWNMDHHYGGHVPELLDALVELDGEITIAIGGGGVPVQPEVYEGLGAAQLPIVVGPFTVISRAKVLEYRQVIASEGIDAAMVRFDCAKTLGRSLTMLLVNLPSDPRRNRWTSATKLASMLEAAAAPRPDIVAGDFNTTRSSRAMRLMFPDFTHAFDAAGSGYGASFPRELPLYHIDHVLLGPDFRAASYELLDMGYSRHLAQRAGVTTARQLP